MENVENRKKIGRAGSMNPPDAPHAPWPRVKLGEVCNKIVDGSHNPPKGVESSPFVMISSKNINDFSIDFNRPRCLSKSDFEAENKRTNIEPDDVLLTIVGTVGRVAVVPLDCPSFCLQRSVAVLKLDRSKCISHFLAFALMAMRSDLEEKAQGTAQKGIYLANLSALEIPLPPFSEQKKIVAKLERELAAVDAMEKRFEEMEKTAETEFKAELKEAFDEVKRSGSEIRRLGDVFNFIDYRGKTPTKIDSGIPLITAKNIRQGYLDYSERFFISLEEFKTRQSRGIAHKGDLLFTTEAPMGFIALADLEVFSTGQRVITFQWPDEKVAHDNRYFLFYFLSDLFQDQLKANASGATAQGIKASRLVNVSVLVPTFPIQRSVVARLDAARMRSERLVSAARKGAETAALLRKALLKEAFE